MRGHKTAEISTNDTDQSQSKTYTQIVSINNLQTHSLQSDIIGRNNVIYAHVVIKSYRSPRFRLLIDTGASFSCLSVDFLKNLQTGGLPVEVLRTKRQAPSSASNHKLETMGDVILNLWFECEDGELEIRNIRFTILRSLSMDMILGIEAIVSLDLRVECSV